MSHTAAVNMLMSLVNSPKGIIIFALDNDYRYIVFSTVHAQVMKSIWGVDIELGKCMLDCIGTSKDREKAKNNFDRALHGEHIVELEEYGDTGLLRTFWENRYSPMYDTTGNLAGVSVLVIDKTEQIQAEQHVRKLAIAQEILKERELLLNSIGEGVFGIDSEGKCFFVNPSAIELLGYSEDQLLGQNPFALICDNERENRPDSIAAAWRSTLAGHRFEGTDQFITRSGRSFPVRLIATPVIRDGIHQAIVFAFTDHTQLFFAEQSLAQANEELRKQVTTDALTKCYNRRYLEEAGLLAWRACSNAELVYSVIATDIDHFKTINDGYGHAIGDDVLVHVADIIRSCVRPGDAIVRMGGEEFCILLPTTDLNGAIKVAERIRKAVERHVTRVDDKLINCTISLGVAARKPHQTELDLLIQQADINLYRAKQVGRNCCIW